MNNEKEKTPLNKVEGANLEDGSQFVTGMLTVALTTMNLMNRVISVLVEELEVSKKQD